MRKVALDENTASKGGILSVRVSCSPWGTSIRNLRKVDSKDSLKNPQVVLPLETNRQLMDFSSEGVTEGVFQHTVTARVNAFVIPDLITLSIDK